jgi:glycosyltransferase involved in cell wall biosynthesis
MLIYISTAPDNLRNQIVGMLAFFRKRGYDVLAVSNPEPDLVFVGKREQVQTAGIPMQREIRPWADGLSLWRMWRLMRRTRPRVVCAGTTKGALLGMLAARAINAPARVYLLLGLRFETTRGWKRWVLQVTERLTARCAHRVVCVSESLRQKYVEFGCTEAEKAIVLRHGSHSGLDPTPFTPTPEIRAAAVSLRAHWGVSDAAPVVGFVGRLVRDKGIIELVDAFELLLRQRPDAWLLLLGSYESGDPVPIEYTRRIAQHPRIISPGFVRELAPYYAAMTVLALPSYREGFPNVVLQANAAEVPVIAFRSTGSVDAVQDGITGALVEVGNAAALADAILQYLNDPELRRKHGQAARRRVAEDFRSEAVWEALDALFCELLNRQNC